MRLAALFSGGKDSTYALFKAMKKHQLVVLISVVSSNRESFMFHTPNIEITQLQAQAIGVPLIRKHTRGEKEKELKDLEAAIRQAKQKHQIQGVVAGAVESEYQKQRIENICSKLDLECLNPLWKYSPERLMRDLIGDGFKIIVSSIAAEGLDKSWLGKQLTDQDIDRLSELNRETGIHMAFEGGEAETLVTDGPIFQRRIVITKGEKLMENHNTGTYRVVDAELE